MQKIYYGDCVLVFSACPDTLPGDFTAIEPGGSFIKMIENLEKYKHVAVVGPDPDRQLHAFMDNFLPVDAAGGVVADKQDRLLMIHRNGRWDLPKGHREEGEPFPQCATREVEEETGIRGLLCGSEPVVTTYHFYLHNGTWEMKRTRWYRLAPLSGELSPQTVEGITSVQWVARETVALHSRTCFPSVREVLTVSGWLDAETAD